MREAAVRALFDSLRATLPPAFAVFTAAGLADQTPFGVAEHVLPALAAQLHKAERASPDPQPPASLHAAPRWAES